MVNGIDRRKISATRAWGLALLITAIGEWAARCHAKHQRPFQWPKSPLYNLYDACGPKRETGLGNPEPQP